MLPSSVPGSTDLVGEPVANRALQIATPTLRCTIRLDAEGAVLCPTGELDIATLPLLDNALRDLRDVGFTTLVVNLRGVTFIDSQGIQLLLRWTTTAAGSGHAFRLVPGPERVQMVFAMTGVLEQFDFEDVECAA